MYLAASGVGEIGVLGAAVGIMESLQAVEAVKYILGIGDFLVGRLLIYDVLTMKFREVELPKRNERCAVCNEEVMSQEF